ncbi:MAG TPA: prepilin-type N-terminal cleavage/methylation domain-containing protein [Gemmatimonadaceae bacterium]|jgi:prepilin-type N-terminal cleavage/methylation domain-containing protein
MLKRRCFAVSELDCKTSIALHGIALPPRHDDRTGAYHRAAFTILELVVVMTIAGVIIAITGKSVSGAFSGNSRSSATRVVSATLFQARAIAIQRSRQSWFVRSGNTLKVLGDSLGVHVQLGKTVDLAQRFGVTLSTVAAPTVTDTTVSFDSRGLITGTPTSLKIIVSKGSKSDTVCATGLGNTRARGC